jgi:hypothetical protein
VLDAFTKYQDVLCITNKIGAITYNVPHVCDAAPSPTRARGRVAERRAAAPRSPRRPLRAPMHVLLYAVAPSLFLLVYAVIINTSRYQIIYPIT